MKKAISILIIMLLTVTLFCACDESAVNLDDINAMLNKEYSGWTISTSTLYNSVRLDSEYIVAKVEGQTEISYSVEQLNELSLEANQDFKSVKTGNVIVKDGKVLSSDGAELFLDLSGMESIGLNFKSKYFEGINKTSSAFSAKVKDINGFMGKEIDATSMTVGASFNANGFVYIKLNYTTSKGAIVTTEYIFD